MPLEEHPDDADRGARGEGPARPGPVATALAMSGLRVDRLRSRVGVAWLAAWSAFLVAYLVATGEGGLFVSGDGSRTAAFAYLALAFLLYYGGLWTFLGHRLGARLAGRFGEERANRWWEAGLGLAFGHQALSAGAVCAADRGSLPGAVPVWLTAGLALALLVAGFGIKFWSTRVLGLDFYYYRDMFLGRATQEVDADFSPGGPYRWFENPMYGAGYLSAYGAALWSRSWLGLVVAVVAQTAIYAFYYRYEKPFVSRAYRIPARAPQPAPAPGRAERGRAAGERALDRVSVD